MRCTDDDQDVDVEWLEAMTYLCGGIALIFLALVALFL